MAALGSILRKGTKSVHSTAQYERLNQDPSDNEEEEDDILFIQEGGVMKQNGYRRPADDANTELLPNGKNNEKIELNDLGIQQARIRKASEVEVRTLRYRSLTMTRIVCFVLTLILAIGFVIGLIIVLPKVKTGLMNVSHYKQTKEWNVTYPEHATESLVQLFDVDEDGRLDIIFSTVPGADMGKSTPSKANEEQFCRDRGFTTSPCIAEVKAIRGYDGALMWQFYAHSSIFEMNCGNIDINKDGKMDCIAAGRLATIVAFDPRKGEVFWRGDQSQMEESWNIYNVLVAPDLNKDGVADLILAHGGDPSFPPEVTERNAGRLLLLDGATGSAIGRRYLEMPDSKETYMSPIMHVRKDGSQYVIFGHGGETVPGTLFAISLPDFYRYVMKMNASGPVPNLTGAYGDWGRKPKSKDGLIEIYRSQKKGVMTPPVCIDITGDGVGDILMSAYEGLITLFDGETLDLIWSTSFPDMESYSTPAPGYFNDDDTPDFMLQQNVGAWPVYSWTQTVILDGKTGQIIWQLNSTHYDMTSDLVARTAEDHRDMFIFQVSGREEAERLSKNKRQKRAARRPEFLLNHQRKHGPPLTNNRQSLRPDRHRTSWPAVPTEDDDTYRNQEYDYKRTHLPQYYRNNARRYGGQLPGTYDYGHAGLLYPDMSEDYDYRDSLFGTMSDVSDAYLASRQPSLSQENNDDSMGDDDDDDDDKHHHGDDQDDKKDKSDGGIISCQNNPEQLITELFIMDRTQASAPLLLYRHEPKRQYYNFTELEREALGLTHDSVDNHHTTQNLKRVKRHGGQHAPVEKYDWSNEACVLMSLAHRCTGAIGDLDGDGTLDLVYILDAISAVKDAKSMDYIRMKYESSLIKINLQQRLSQSRNNNAFTPIKVTMKDLSNDAKETSFSDMHFRPYEEQPWTKYLGKHSDSVYAEPKSES